MRLTEWQCQVEAYLLGAEAAPAADLLDSLRGGPTLNAEDGMLIYYNAYRSRFKEVLREDYAVLLAWLGEDEFEQLLDDYLHSTRSDHFSLRWLGARLPAFIEQSGDGALAELARVEWAFTLAFDAPQGEPLTLQDMATLPAEAWPALRLGLLPSVQWLNCRHNSMALWRTIKNEQDVPASAPLDNPAVCLIWRLDLVTRFRLLEPSEAWALDGMVHQGWTFAQLCEELGAFVEAPPVQAATWLKQWISEGLLQREG